MTSSTFPRFSRIYQISTRKTGDDYDHVCHSSWSTSLIRQQPRPCRPRTRPALRDLPQALFFCGY
ncbi:hypothetical protein EXIGLDRAFT_733705 [Exidia glandulosa HHB12029]|uniref:Uncharacterized protein n=1 Tax=Exidia glandulosa HHB12029 TaxID=1314781 RepID=A0A165B888_EXIGL|nr:hypothetical protein EXIGLDRAFT_733705 [Exidia glandulosa HHB12029]